MFDLAKWEDAHPAVKRFARQVADVLESVAEHLIGQAEAAVLDAISPPAVPVGAPALPTPDPRAVADSTLPADPDLSGALSAPLSAEGAPTDPPTVNAAQAPAQPGGVAIGGVPVPSIPADVAAWLAASGWTPPAVAPRGAGAGGVADSGGAGSTLPDPDLADVHPADAAAAPVPGVDHPITGPVESAGPAAGADVPITHNIGNPADIVGQGNAGT